MTNYLNHLNSVQQEGVVHTEGPCLVIAGAGSGKTRVLAYRIAHLIQHQRVDPFQIMALTFTNKAASEMRHRIETIVGTEARGALMGTFHSIFSRILRVESEAIGYPRNFSIYDTDDSKSLIKKIIRDMNLDDTVYKPNVVYHRISNAKNQLINWQEYMDNPLFLEEDELHLRPEIRFIYKTYATRCYLSGAMDFDDLLLLTYRLFSERLDLLNKYQHHIKYVLVDEFQDTNLCQYQILHKLASVHRNICVVGDDAQSIYGFRGADIGNILHFQEDYPDLHVIKMEQNYRSTKTIVGAANSIIKKNKDQLAKDIWTDNELGSPIEIITSSTDNEEGNIVASAIFQEKAQNHLHFNDFVVLYRTNYQSRAIEEAFRHHNIKYKIVGGTSFYQRKEIKDVLAYLRFLTNPNDEVSLRRIINYPKRGIGNSTIDKIIVAAHDHAISLFEVLNNIASFVPGRAASMVENFVAQITKFKLYIERHNAYEAASEIVNSSGLLKELYNDKTSEGINRYENVQELLNAINAFIHQPDREDRSIAAFLQEVSLITNQDEDTETEVDQVKLMTIHMAKGLEFKYVFTIGLEEKLFPSNRLSNRAELEEERRLFYVALTRAQIKVYLTHTLSRYQYGKHKTCEPSRFLTEIDPSYIKQNSMFGKTQRPTTQSFSYARQLVDSARKQQQQSRIIHKTPIDFTPSNVEHIKENMKVEHPKFGFGTVLKIEHSTNNHKAIIAFDSVGEKTLLLNFAKLRIQEK